MHPRYVAELRRLDSTAGDTSESANNAWMPVGSSVRITAAGKYHGQVGSVVKRGRTRYHVHLPEGVVTVPFHLASPSGQMAVGAQR